jgi:glycosyltransferase involved in cell wall biosynthesis
MKKLFVIVGAFKAQDYILDMIKSFEAQEPYEDWRFELKIGVDGCNETRKVLENIGYQFNYFNENHGVYVVRNSLIQSSDADLFVIFDADDLMHTNFLKECIIGTENNQIFCCGKNVIDLSTGSKIFSRYGGGICSFRKASWQKIGGYREDRIASDTDLILRFCMAGETINVSNEALYDYRRHSDSLTLSEDTCLKSKRRDEIVKDHENKRLLGEIKIKPIIADFVEFKSKLNVSDKDISVIIFVPSNAICEYRIKNYAKVKKFWQNFGFKIIEVYPENIDNFFYNKSLCANIAALEADSKILIFADADCLIAPEAVKKAIIDIDSGRHSWGTINTHVLRLSKEETEIFLEDSLPISKEKSYVGQKCGGLFLITRDLFIKIGGYDERFEGWGGEDTALSLLLDSIEKGYLPEKEEVLVHLWHPCQISKTPNVFHSKNKNNEFLITRYLCNKNDKYSLMQINSERFDNKEVNLSSLYKGGTKNVQNIKINRI